MSWEKVLDQYDVLIEKKLEEFFEKVKDEAKTYHPFIEKVYSDIEEFVLRKGKRLASYSTFITYKSYTDVMDNRIMKVCVGIELYRHCILVHDDLVDKDLLRRGKKTLHEVFAEYYDDRLGEGTAVFVGNIIYALALQALLNSGFAQGKTERVASLLSEGYRNVNESQTLDLLFEYTEPDINEWYVMASRRAASLFKTTILAGAILGNAPEKDVGILGEAATNIGYSFDIQDDIIDTFASPGQYGREPGGDVANRKKPLHLIYALKLVDRKNLNTLKDLVGKKPLLPKDLEMIKATIRESGALRATKEKSKNHAKKARLLIAQTSLSDEAKNFFANLIKYIGESLEWYK